MRILHVIPSVNPASGGPAEGVRQLCHIYQSSGHQVEVVSLDAQSLIKEYNFPATVFGLGPGWGIYGYCFGAAKWFREHLPSYDVVFINCIWQYNTLAAYWALAHARTPYAVFTHGMLDPYFKRRFPLKHLKKMIYWHLFLQRVLRGATTLLFTCEEEKVLARQSFLHYRVREMVVPYGIFGPDCDKAAGVRDFLKNWPGLKGKRMAISMGRINPKKGTDILIRAFAATLANDPLWRLVIAGPDEKGLRNSLTSLAESLGVADRVTWTGMLKDKMKWGALASAEVFVLPSHQENFGIVVAEALASGLPVIISDKVNIWREVANRWAGLICDDTLEGTTTALRRWQSLSADEIAALRIRSKKCFDELFNYETTAKSALEIVEFVARQQR